MAEAARAAVVRFGIVGCAEIARKLCRAIHLAPNAALVAVGSRSLDKARRFVADNGLQEGAEVASYGSYEEVLDDPRVDAVYVPLPTSLHVRWAVAAAERGKHVLLEKPTALRVADLDRVLGACEGSGVQFMDGTMWMHHPRTAKMKEVLSDPTRFGQLRSVHSSFTFPGDPNFLENNIRVKPDLDALGALGDAGWYCVRAILWAAGFHLPATATAIHGSATTNAAGVILSCAASLHWPDDGKFATFHCSFLSYLSMDLLAVGSRGTLHLSDLVGPLGDFIGPPSVKGSAAFTTASGFALPEREVVETEVPQEVHMVTEFARLVQGIRDCRAAPEGEWAEMSRKTQLVVDAVKASIDNGYQSVEIGK